MLAPGWVTQDTRARGLGFCIEQDFETEQDFRTTLALSELSGLTYLGARRFL
jgi:hypothetical protein